MGFNPRREWSNAVTLVAQQGHLDIVELLLQHKADPALPDQDGKTARQLAVEAKQRQIVALLTS